MQKTLTLFPQYITDGSNFGGILSANGTGQDYRTLYLNKGHHTDKDKLHVGTIAFNTSVLWNKSKACLINNYSIYYDQKADPDLGSGAGAVYTCVGKLIDNFSVNGSQLVINSMSDFGNSAWQWSTETDDSWHGKTCTFLNGSVADVIGNEKLIGFDLTMALRSPVVAKEEAYMRNLWATVTYTAKYYAYFYDGDGKTLIETQTVEGGKVPIPDLSKYQKEGYDLIGWRDWTGKAHSSIDYFYSEDTDVSIYPIYQKKEFEISVPRGRNGADWQVAVRNEGASRFEFADQFNDGSRSTFKVEYGKEIELVAYRWNDLSQDLFVIFDESTRKRFDGSQNTSIIIYKTSKITSDLYINSVGTIKVYKDITTACNDGGEITPSFKAARSYNYSLSVTPYVGYEIAKITKNGVEIEITDKNSMTVSGVANEEHSYVATFQRIKIPVTFNHDEKITVTGETNVNYGELNKWTITAADGYSINQIKIGDEIILDAFEKTETYELSRVCIEPITVDITATNNFVTVTAETCENGTIIGDLGTYIKGKGTLNFEAKPNVGYRFFAWTGVDWTTQTYELDTATAEDSYTLGATFEECAYQVRVTIYGNGTVEQSAEYVNYGESVTLKAIPDEGWHFDCWKIERESANEVTAPETEETTITNIRSNINVTVTFKISQFDFATSVSSSDGAGIGGTINGSDKTKYDYHTELNLEAVPDEGYYFVKWSDDVFNPKRTYVIPAENTALTACFERYEYRVTVEGDKGKIELTANGATAENEATVKYGDDLQLLITPDFGYRISDVILNGVSIKEQFTTTLKNSRCVFQKITANYDIKVIFEEKMYTNGRRLIDYYPPVIAAIKDMQQIVKGQQPLIDELWDAVSFVTENQFIDTATEEGVKQWENELGIVPSSTETLNQRKKRLKNKWVPDNRFTMIWLYDWLKQVSERNDLRKPTVKDYILTVTLPAIVDYLSIFADLENYKPANIALNATISLADGIHNLNSGIGIKSTIKTTIEREVESDENQTD